MSCQRAFVMESMFSSYINSVPSLHFLTLRSKLLLLLSLPCECCLRRDESDSIRSDHSSSFSLSLQPWTIYTTRGVILLQSPLYHSPFICHLPVAFGDPWIPSSCKVFCAFLICPVTHHPTMLVRCLWASLLRTLKGASSLSNGKGCYLGRRCY